MDELIKEVVCLYQSTKRNSLREIAREFDLSVGKVTKLLVTAGVYSTPISDEVQALYKQGKSIADIQKITGLSKSSVHNYLPYTKTVYNAKELSQNAERIVRYRKRLYAIEELHNASTMDNLWSALIQFAGYRFCTYRGLSFRYTIVGGEIFIDRKENSKSITRSSVAVAFEEAIRLMEEVGYVAGPKKLKAFGASYLYAIFVRFEIICEKESLGC